MGQSGHLEEREDLIRHLRGLPLLLSIARNCLKEIMRRQQYALFLPLVVIIAVFWPVCGHDFLGYDDEINIFNNSYVTQFSFANLWHFWEAPFHKLYIPLTYTLWAAQAKISAVFFADHGNPLNPHFFHTVNLIVHAGTTSITFFILRRLRINPWPAAAGAVLFAIHPTQVEPVAWATGFKDLLSGFWSMLAIWLYIVYAQSALSIRRTILLYILSILTFLLAMLAKPAAVVVPLIAATIGWQQLKRPFKLLCLELIPWIVCALPIVLVTQSAQQVANTETALSLWQRLLVAGDTLAFYMYKLVLPVSLGADYGRTPDFVLAHGWVYASGLLPYILAIYLLWQGRTPLLLTAAGIFVAALLPVLGLITFHFQQISTVADRYLYLALLGPAFALGWGLTRHAPIPARALCLITLALLGAKSFTQAQTWKNSLTMSRHTIEVNPASWLFYNNLGMAYKEANDPLQAINSLKESIRLKPNFDLPYVTLGALYKEIGQQETARSYYQQALKVNPRQAHVHNALGVISLNLRDTAKAMEHFKMAIEIQPDYAKPYANLGIVYTTIHNPDAAIAAYRQAIERDVGLAGAYINLAALYKDQNNIEEAIACYRRAIALQKNPAEAYTNLGLLYSENQRSEEAIDALSKAIAANRNFAPAYLNLSKVYLTLKQYPLAIEYAAQAKSLGLSDPLQDRALEPYRNTNR